MTNGTYEEKFVTETGRIERNQDLSPVRLVSRKEEEDPAHSSNLQEPRKMKQQWKQFPSMLFEHNPVPEINEKIRKKYLVFRVYEDPI